MKASRFRLIVAAVLFIGWMGYLGYLALATPKATVVSRSQLLGASHVVMAEVMFDGAGKPKPQVGVMESFGQNIIADQFITVENLANARVPGGKAMSNPGTYLLLLERPGGAGYRVAGTPGAEPIYLVYPWSGDVQRQIRELVKP